MIPRLAFSNHFSRRVPSALPRRLKGKKKSFQKRIEKDAVGFFLPFVNT